MNLTPACSERTDWLVKMVDCMSSHLLHLVLPKETLLNMDFQKDEDFYWDLIYNEKDFKDNNNYNKNQKLEIEGFKANIKKERNLDKKYHQLV